MELKPNSVLLDMCESQLSVRVLTSGLQFFVDLKSISYHDSGELARIWHRTTNSTNLVATKDFEAYNNRYDEIGLTITFGSHYKG